MTVTSYMTDLEVNRPSSRYEARLIHRCCFIASDPLDGNITFGFKCQQGQLSSTNISSVVLFDFRGITCIRGGEKRKSKQDAVLNNLEKRTQVFTV